MDEKTRNHSVQLTVKDGVASIEQGTALTRLHYFDGKFLRADALTLEQDYHRMLVRLSNLAGGWGVVHGLGISLAGDQLSVTPGLAITPAGSTVLLSDNFSVEVGRLIATATPTPASPAAAGLAGKSDFENCDCTSADSISATTSTGYYEITAGPVEGLCGNEEVYGKLCEDACVTDSQSPYWKEGLVLRLRPIQLSLPGSTTVLPVDGNLRSRVASAYFAAEPWLTNPLLSASGLGSKTWCNPATLYNRDEVPIGLLVRDGATTRFIDAWSARRERMDTQARGYWQGRMMMRPWNVFLAQILQFQCQLSSVFRPGSKEFDPIDDDCKKLRALLSDSLRELEMARRKYADGSKKILEMLGDHAKALDEMESPFKHLDTLTSKLSDAQDSLTFMPKNRMLINAGFMELPPAGYLPVVPGKLAINEQLQRMFGEGVNLHFCAARPDFIPHALEEDQHMQRISLTRGLDHPAQKEEVEIFVPDGQIIDSPSTQDGIYWFAEISTAFMGLLDINLDKKSGKDGGVMSTADAVKEEALKAKLAKTNEATTSHAAPAKPDEMAATAKKRQQELVTAYRASVLQGIARTSRLDNGGAAITIVCQTDNRQDGYASKEKTLLDALYAETGAGGTTTRGDTDGLPLAIYIDLRVTQNPFARQEGDEILMGYEFCSIRRKTDTSGQDTSILEGNGQRGNGTLSIDSVTQLQSSSILVEATARVGNGKDAMEIPVRFKQEGNAQSGHFSLQAGSPDTGYSSASSKRLWAADWNGHPRSAIFGQELQSAGNFYQARPVKEKTGDPGGNTTRMEYADSTDTAIRPLLKLRESETAFKPENTIRLTALNTLAEMADAVKEPAFLARARGRLFPGTAASTNTVSVRATQDWVMFRRQRKAACDTSCPCTPPVAAESYQAWHVRLEDAGALDILQQAIDQDQADILQKFRFGRVNVLHYADASLSPVENLGILQEDWKNANPGKTVLLGRAWESPPNKGRGAQNSLRLQRLVKLLDGLLDMPATGVIHSLVKPPQPLNDTQFDGGMLLVTADQTDARLQHRVYIVSAEYQQEQLRIIQSQSESIYYRLEKYADQKINLDIDPATNMPDATELAKLKILYDGFKSMDTTSIVLIGKAAGTDSDAKAQFSGICTGMGIPAGIPGFASAFRVNDNNFGSGIEAATVVYFNVENR